MKDIINNLGKMAVCKMRLINRVRKSEKYADNIRKCPIYSEFYGILQTLSCMQIDVEIDWHPEDVYTMSAITINGIRFNL